MAVGCLLLMFSAIELFSITNACKHRPVGLWTVSPSLYGNSLPVHCVLISPELYRCKLTHQMAGKTGQFYRPVLRRCWKRSLVAIILLMSGDVESNPGPIYRTNSIEFAALNTNSARNKASLLHDLITDYNLDFLAVTETRLRDDDPSAIKDDIAPEGYSVRHFLRLSTDKRPLGGGVSLIHRSTFRVASHPTKLSPSSFELLTARVTSVKPPLTVAVVYRPPDRSTTQFNDELADSLSQLVAANTDRLLLCGDVNRPGDCSTSVASDLAETIDVHGLVQHVRSPTRENNVLDILAVDSTVSVANVRVVDAGFSDHRLIVATIRVNVDMTRPATSHAGRDMRRLDLVDFERRLRHSTLFTAPRGTADDFTEQIRSVVTAVLDEVAPIKCYRRRASKPITKWLSNEAVKAKRFRRRCERRFRKTRVESDRVAFRLASRRANKLINRSRSDYFRSQLTSSTDSKTKWQTVKKLLHSGTNNNSNCCSDSDTQSLCNTFADYFHSKIANLNRTVATVANTAPLSSYSDPPLTGPKLCSVPVFQPSDVLKLLACLKSSTSNQDFLPTSLLKSCPAVFSEIICHLANLSFATGVFPSQFKSASVTPLLKKPHLDPSCLSNYRPISHLNTISKILERLLLSVLQPHVTACSSFNPLQSAYRPFHSTETALLHTLNHIYEAADSGNATLLVSLDLSAAFDTINHHLLISRLQHSFGLSGSVISWLQSYLAGRSQTISVGQFSSYKMPVTSGVPQGSVLGPILFSIYTSPIAQIVSSHCLQHQQYADDTQLFMAVNSQTAQQNVSRLETCLTDLSNWLCHNGLCLNPSKSEAILFGTRQRLETIPGIGSVDVAGETVSLSNVITTLGLTLDSNLSFSSHINSVSKSCYFHIKALRHIRSSLPDDVCANVAAAIVQSRLDYANSLLYKAADRHLNSLQRVQNCLARVVLPNSSSLSSPHLLYTLHWLPVNRRIDFKIAVLTYNTLLFHQPAYIADLVSYYVPSRALRSSDHALLCQPRTRTAFGSRAFSSAAPRVWNAIPLNIRLLPSLNTFKRQLKTHYFYSP